MQPYDFTALDRALRSQRPDLYGNYADQFRDTTGVLGQLVGGFVQGFTTLPWGPDPDSPTEAIARSVGSLLGFIGYVPGVGSVGKLATMGVGRVVTNLGGRATAAGLGRTGGALATGGGFLAANAPRFRSVPLLAGDLVVNTISRAARRSAGLEASKFVGRHTLGRDLLRGAALYGTASGVSAWTSGVDAMAEAALYGAGFGLLDRTVGNVFPHRGPGTPGLATLFGRDGAENAYKMAARALSASSVQGGLSTLRGDPLELQVYEYLLGGVFGGLEISRHQRAALESLMPFYQNPGRRPELVRLLSDTTRPETVIDGWDRLTPEAREEVVTQAAFDFGRWVDIGRMEGTPEEVAERVGVNVAQVAVARGLTRAAFSLLDAGRLSEDQARYLVEHGILTEEHAARFAQPGSVSETNLPDLLAPMLAREATSAREAMDGTQPLTAGERAAEGESGVDAESSRGAEVPGTAEPTTSPTARPRASGEGVFRLFTSHRTQLAEAYRDHDVPVQLAMPVREAAVTLARALDEGEVVSERVRTVELELVASIGRHRAEAAAKEAAAKEAAASAASGRGTPGRAVSRAERLAMGDDTFTAFLSDVEARYQAELPVGSPAWNALRKTWLKLDQLQEPVHQWVWNARSGRLEPRKAVDSTGQRTARYRGRAALDDVFEALYRDTYGADPVGPLRIEIDTVELPPPTNAEGVPQGRGQTSPIHDLQNMVDGLDAVLADAPLKQGLERLAGPSGDVVLTMEAARAGGRGADAPDAYLVFGGVKDKGKVILTRAFVARRDAPGVIRSAFEALPDGGASSVVAAYRRDRERFIEQAAELGYDRAEAREVYDWHAANNIRVAEAMNGMAFADMVRHNEAGTGQFVLDAVGLNKRMQVLDAGEVRLSDRAFDGTFGAAIEDLVPGADGRGSLAVEIVNGLAKGGGVSHPIEGGRGRLTHYVLADDGAVREVPYEAHVDGVFMLRDDVFDAMARYTGWGDDTGAQKGVLTQQDTDASGSGQGLLIGKYAYHRAGSEQSAAMRERGSHGQLYDTGAKQRGTRKVYNRQLHQVEGTARWQERFYTPGGTHAVEPEKTLIRPESLTNNLSTGESRESALKDQRLMIQAHSNLLSAQGGEAAIRAFIEQQAEAAFRGDEATGAALSEYLSLRDAVAESARAEADRLQTQIGGRPKKAAASASTLRLMSAEERQRAEARMRELAEKIDVERMGVEHLVSVVRGPVLSDNPLYERVASHLLRLADDDMMARLGGEMDAAEREVILDAFAEQRSAVDQVLAVVRPRPFVMEDTVLAPIKPFFERVVMNHVMSRVLSPKVEGSVKAVMAPMDPWLMASERFARPGAEDGLYPYEPGTFYFHDGAGEKRIPWKRTTDASGKTTTETKPLRKAWAEFQAAGGWGAHGRAGAPLWMQQAMEMVGARSPADSVSGMRVLRFGGFTGRRGYGAVFHPHDMGYMGGADLDIDTGFLYPTLSMPIEMVDHYRRHAREWEREVTYTAPSGERQRVWALVPSKASPEAARILGLHRTAEWEPGGGDGGGPDGDRKNPATMVSPLRRLEAVRGATKGNRLLGVALNYANRFHTMLDMIHAGELGDNGVIGAREVIRREGEPERLSGGDTWVPDEVRARWMEEGLIQEGDVVFWTGRAAQDRGLTLRFHKREAVNRAADSADTPDLVGRDQMGFIMGHAAFDEVRVYRATKRGDRLVVREVRRFDPENPEGPGRSLGEEVDPTWSRTFGRLTQANRLLNGRDYRAGRALGLDDLWRGYRLPGYTARGEPKTAPGIAEMGGATGRLPSTLVRLLSVLARVDVPADRRQGEGVVKGEEVRFWTPGYLGDQWMDTLAMLDRLAADRSPEGQLLRDLIVRMSLTTQTRVRGDRPPRSAQGAAQGRSAIPGGGQAESSRGPGGMPDERQAYDFPRQDLMDHASAAVLYREGLRLYEGADSPAEKRAVLERLSAIGDRVAELKANQAYLVSKVSEAAQRGDYVPQARTMEALAEHVEAFFRETDPAYREWASLYYLGSLRPQHAEFEAMPEVQANAAAQAEARQRRDIGAMRALRDERTQLLRAWHRTNADSKAFAVGAASPEAIRAYYDQLGAMVEATWRPGLSADDVADIYRRGQLDSPALDDLMGRDPVTGEGLASKAGRSMQMLYEAPGFVEGMADLLGVNLDAAATDPQQRARIQALEDRVAELAYHNPDWFSSFPSLFAGTVARMREHATALGTMPEVMTLRDLEEFVGFFSARYRRDPWTETDEERRENPLQIKWYHYFWWPGTFDRMLAPYTRQREQALGFAVTPEGVRMVEVEQYVSDMGRVHTIWNHMMRHLDGIESVSRHNVRERFGYLDALGEDGQKLFEAAVAMREYRIWRDKPGEGTDLYRQHYEAAEALLRSGLGKKSFTLPRTDADGKPDGADVLTGRQLVERMDRDITRWAEDVYRDYIDNPSGWDALLFEGVPRDAPDFDPLSAPVDVRATVEGLVRSMLDTRTPTMLGFNALSRLVHQYQLDRIEVMSDGAAESLSEARRARDEARAAWEARVGAGEDPSARTPEAEALLAAEQALARVEAESDAGAVVLGSLTGQAKARAQAALLERRPDLAFRPTKAVAFDAYFPHNGHPQRMVERILREKQAHMAEEGVGMTAKVHAEIALKAQLARETAPDGAFAHEPEIWLGEHERVAERSLEEGGLRYRPGHLLSRGENTPITDAEGNVVGYGGPMPGYEKSVRAMERYTTQLLKGHHNQLASIMSHVQIDDFVTRNPMGELTPSWARFMRLFNRDAMGLASIFPESWLADKDLKLRDGGPLGRTNPYYYFTSDWIDQKARSISARFFGGEGSYLDGKRDLMSERVRRFSTWEGRYQLMALLSHTKTWVNNVVFGHANTAISGGFGTWAKAGNLNWLRANINPAWQGMEEVYRFVEQYGGVENYIINEVSLPERFRTERMTDFVQDLKREIRQGSLRGMLPGKLGGEAARQWDYTVGQLMEKHGISRSVMNAAAFFMRHSEYRLRTRAWLTHYIKARETLAMNGVAFEADHPWLITLANRGVEATQFLYDNANRPAFSRTPLGRIFSRFQIWAWNSVRFRRDIFREAAQYGWQPGSPEMAKLNRLAVAELFVLGLAEMFPLSMFDSGIAPPMQWALDLSQLFFGDEEDKRRAFFGLGEGLGPAAVIGIASPPVARPVTAVFNTMFTGDWSRWADYHLWTLFPFGRMARDTKKVVENPIRVSEHLTGFPLMRVHERLRSFREDEIIAPGSPLGPLPNYRLPERE